MECCLEGVWKVQPFIYLFILTGGGSLIRVSFIQPNGAA